jgi:tetratricopeptide (TPR) repeat protein
VQFPGVRVKLDFERINPQSWKRIKKANSVSFIIIKINFLMADSDKIKQLLIELKNCSVADISKYFSPVTDLIRFLPREDKNECVQNFHKWAEENIHLEPLKFCYAEFLKALICFTNEENELALHLLTRARKEFEEQNDPDGMGLCSMLTGAIYRTFGNFELAMKILWEGYSLLKQSGKYPISMAACTNSMGNINLEMQNYDEALSMFNITYEQSERSGDFYFSTYALHGLGRVHMLLNDHSKAKECFDQAMIMAEKNNNPLQVANSITALADFYYRTGNLKEAEQLNVKALAIRRQQNFILGAITNCIHLGEIFIQQSKWDEALGVLNQGLALAEQTRVKPKIYQVHFLLSEIYQQQNNLELSLFHYKKFHDLREQVEKEDYGRKLADAKLIFEAEQTKKENVIIKRQKEEIVRKNIELQETIDELTLTRVSRKAKALTLVVAITLFIIQDFILGFALHHLPNNSYLFSLVVKMGIIFSLSPINKAIERYLLKKVIKNPKQGRDIPSFEPGVSTNVA